MKNFKVDLIHAENKYYMALWRGDMWIAQPLTKGEAYHISRIFDIQIKDNITLATYGL